MVDHRVPNFADEINLRRFFGKLIKDHFKFEFGILIYAKTHEHHPVPDYISEYIPSSMLI